MIVVADTTPISELAKVGYLNLLYELFQQVIIPQEVYSELITGNHPAAEIVSTLSWLEVDQIRDPKQVKVLQSTSNLDLGEVAAIILAEELQADQLLKVMAIKSIYHNLSLAMPSCHPRIIIT